ncbi:unnamed protein product [Moneuplotes crassus]|uniref:Helicase ATP-binding domain-containing protein n=1 Tax=Euplotes crassus TaxID=5936 RepID=A0AAD1XZX9_EUPCR|nr:unnamed protein product [Moneuplotes crassus]
MSFEIGGIKVKFPFEPYGIQKNYMQRLIKAVETKKNAMLESPTGTGKTLSSICSALAYQKNLNEEGTTTSNYDRKIEIGYEPERPISQIIFSSRTHSQLDQVIKEVKRCGYSPRTASLASRKYLCINEEALNYKHGVDRLCKILRSHNKDESEEEGEEEEESERDEEEKNKAVSQRETEQAIKHPTCYYYQNLKEFKNHYWKKDKGEIMDIEDIVEHGKLHSICPYYLQKEKAKTANLVTMPYNYIINPRIRKHMEVSLQDSIVIVDEAHNFGPACESNATVELDRDVLKEMLKQIKFIPYKLAKLKKQEESRLNKKQRKLRRKIQEIGLSKQEIWDCIHLVESFLEAIQVPLKHRLWDVFQVQDYTDAKMLEFEKLPLLLNQVYQRYIITKIGSNGLEGRASFPYINQDNLEDWLSTLSRTSALLRLISNLSDILCDSLVQIIEIYCDISYRSKHSQTSVEEEAKLLFNQFQICVSEQKIPKEKFELDETLPKDREFENILKFECLSPEYLAKKLQQEQPRSLILISGTLYPFDEYSSELGVEFPITFRSPHVIDRQQMCLIAMKNGISGDQLKLNYINRAKKKVIEDLAKTVNETLLQSEGGSLAFFPSYSVMGSYLNFCKWKRMLLREEKLIITGEAVDCYSINSDEKSRILLIEPRETSELNKIRKAFYQLLEEDQNVTLVCVCRGKISEGIDLPDKASRLAIVVGIPYAYLRDSKVQGKKKYLDMKVKFMRNSQSSEGTFTLDGDKWYQTDAQRAINQAIGRVIRHKNDYGAVVLQDSRYENLVKFRSSWCKSWQKRCFTMEFLKKTLSSFYTKMNKFEATGEIPDPFKSVNCGTKRAITMEPEFPLYSYPSFKRVLREDPDQN